MLQESLPLWPWFEARRRRSEDLVLAILTDVIGSSYKKPGALVLIDTRAEHIGLISGGCLETDLCEHAASVIGGQAIKLLEYDLGDESPFGLGLGCNGQIRVCLLPLDAASAYGPLALLAPLSMGRSDNSALRFDFRDPYQPRERWHLKQEGPPSTAGKPCVVMSQDIEPIVARNHWPQQPEIPVRPLPQLLIAGAGIDALPLVHMACCQHWRVTVYDHRNTPKIISEIDPRAKVLTGASGQLSQKLRLSDFDAVVVMSHNLERDQSYLEQVGASTVPYIGLLGPPARRGKIFKQLPAVKNLLGNRLHSPAGLDLGGHGPESVALSIVAELHQFFAARKIDAQASLVANDRLRKL